ncbi:MAG: Electron transport complex protein RnfG [Betaproteobacteria bacterium ADurb.Bin341]|nr:MAG: Electron transport complex protein RnfG [Betaproteobacteria bacterium ADurb.Bin341]
MTVPKPQYSAPQMAVRTALLLLVFTVVFTALLAGVYRLTRPAIATSALQEKMKLVNEVLPNSEYDNDPLKDSLPLPPTPELGLNEPSTLYRARRAGQPVALVFEAVAPDGYAGKIRLLVAVRADGRILGVRAISHKETPGLGDYIEPKKDKNKTRPWITQFNDLSADAPETAWKVKKDGGNLDYHSGATVTPRAVAKAIRKAAEFTAKNKEKLFAGSGGTP